MAIYRLLEKSTFSPEEAKVLAYEATLRKLGLVDRADPITEIVAKKVIEVAGRGGLDARQITAQAITELGVRT